jgi:hypothetical protein
MIGFEDILLRRALGSMRDEIVPARGRGRVNEMLVHDRQMLRIATPQNPERTVQRGAEATPVIVIYEEHDRRIRLSESVS